MYLIAIAWMYVVLMMAVAEATSPQGSVLGAIFTFLLYGLLPLSILLYILGTPARKRRLRAAEAAEDAERAAAAQASALATAAQQAASTAPDRSGHAPGDPLAAERKEA
jgi:membrane protein implicated in regulation of membrane protease activity